MSREYVVAKADGMLDIRFPSGSSSMRVLKGRRYLKREAFVVQNPDYFEPIKSSPTENQTEA
jgi:hypothetical protein